MVCGADINDFYLMQGILMGVLHPNFETALEAQDLELLTSEAHVQRRFDALVDQYADNLERYAHAAIGGELRHHNKLGGTYVSYNRRSAWAGWKQIVDQLGYEQAYLDAEEIFLDFSGGSMGGKKWAECAEALRKYLTGEYNKVLWIDRCVNLQHNGGAFMNKINWPNANRTIYEYSLQWMFEKICPAHADEPTDWRTMYAVASPEVQMMVEDHIRLVNDSLMMLGKSGLRENPIAKPQQKTSRGRVRKAMCRAHHEAWQTLIEEIQESWPEEIKIKYQMCINAGMIHDVWTPETVEDRWQPGWSWNRKHQWGWFAPIEDLEPPPDCPKYHTNKPDDNWNAGYAWPEFRYYLFTTDLSLGMDDWKYLHPEAWLYFTNAARHHNLIWKKWGNSLGSGYSLVPKKGKK